MEQGNPVKSIVLTFFTLPNLTPIYATLSGVIRGVNTSLYNLFHKLTISRLYLFTFYKKATALCHLAKR